jgi:trk system potassium uptake protein TrkH
VRDSAGVLVGVYALFTAVHALLLRLAGMSTFDAIFHAFSSMSTGGFSNRGQSIAYYRSPLIEAICIVFMIVAGTNFAIWGAGWRRGPMEALRAFARSAEVHAYLLLLGGGSLVLTLVLWFWGGSNGQAGSDLPDYTGFLHCLRDATFNLVSIQTCTGYATADFDRWPDACRLLLMIGAFFGACAGSTGGGIKILRVVVVVRASLSAVRSFARPRVVEQLRIDGDRLEDERITSATRYFVLWILAALVGSLLLTLLGSDVTTALSSVVCCLNNVGPGLGSVGPATDYGFFDPASKLLLCALMILGRLEFYALVTLLLPGFWRR